MVTFMALAGMRGGRFDPRMYQYGGLWIYPVGALLKLASLKWIHLVTLKPDLNYYLDHPEQFGRFYIVARVYSGLWGLIGIAVVFALARRFSKTLIVPAVAACGFIFMPVVINAAHEAKPHLAGAVLVMLAAWAGCRYVETGRRRWGLITGAFCGMAVGMVLSAAVAFVVLPLMALLRQKTWAARLKVTLLTAAVGLLVYAVTNPYVPINLVGDPAVVRANLGALGQAKAIVGKSNELGAIPNARRLIVEGASIVGGVLGVTALLLLIFNRAWWMEHARERVVLILLGTPALLVLIQFVWLAGGKTGEFGRFAILPDIVLMLAGVILVASLPWSRRWPAVTLIPLVILVAVQGLSYWAGFIEDARGGTRLAVARELAELHQRGARTLGVRAEPAPYCLPPVDVTAWKIVLLPADGDVPEGAEAPDVVVMPVDAIGRGEDVAGTPYRSDFVRGKWPWLKTRISWADKPFALLVRK